MEEEKKTKKLSRKEIAWYSIAGGLAFVGLVFCVFGIIGDHLPVLASDNWVIISENAWLKPWLHIGYRWFGLILVAIGVLIGVIALCVFARDTDKDSERAARRAKRLAALASIKDDAPGTVKEESVVDVPAEETKAE